MKFSIDKQEKYTLLNLSEENLNSVNAPDLKSEVVILYNEGTPNFILDISQVKYVDSSGLSAILTCNRLWQDGGTFVLCGATQPMVKKLIEISRLDSLLNIIPTPEEAVDFVFMEELERELGNETEPETDGAE